MPENTFSIVFCGTSPFAVPSLHALAADPRFSLSLVITQPDRPAGRHRLLTPPPVKTAAEQYGVPLHQPASLNKDHAILAQYPCDFLVVVSYGQILSQAILDRPAVAPVNVHASLLPRWRGASPIQHAILAGDAETGVTIQVMQQALDAGPILAQERTAIHPRDTAVTLHDRLATIGAALLIATLTKPLQPTPQDAAKATLCGKLSREDGRVHPIAMTAEEIDRRVRALTPWPGVTAQMDGQEVKMLETSLEPVDDGVPLPCKDQSMLYLRMVQPAGKKPMRAVDWRRGKKGL